jgi:hypothetical protein
MRILLFLLFTAFSLNASAQLDEIKASEILKLLPDNIDGFKPSEEFKSEQLKIGTLTYTLCEKKFSAGKRSIQFLLFDFLHANIMYKQSMSKWNGTKPAETETEILRAIDMEYCTGWESYQKHTERSEISLGIRDRYLLEITGSHVDLATLQSILSQVALEKFPK